MSLLTTSLEEVSKLSKEHKIGLHKLGLFTVRDLLFYFPFRYSDDYEEKSLASGTEGELITVYGVLEKVKVRRSFKGHIPMTEATIADNSGTLRLVWFNQAYIGKMYGEGAKVKISGALKKDSKGFLLSNPHIERAPEVTPHLEESLFKEVGTNKSSDAFLVPVYKETKGVTSNFLYHLVRRAVEQGALLSLVDTLPEHIVRELSLPELKDALLYIHFPKNKELTVAARKRFAFEEIFLMKLLAEKEKAKLKHSPAYSVEGKESVSAFLAQSSFAATKAQTEAIKTILSDLAKVEPMGRLLEGDVGSGKTFVAGAAIAAVVGSHHRENKQPLQVAYMAPTEILAKQHFDSFCEYFKESKLSLGLLTSGGCKKFPSKSDGAKPTDISKRQLITWMEKGEISLVVGTHALIQKSVAFKQLALIIIDEQHRFGVKQRAALANKQAQTSQTNAELADNAHSTSDDFLYKDLSYIIRGICFEIKKELGVRHKELIYQNAFEIELNNRKIGYVREKQLPVSYGKQKVGVYQPDFIIEDKIVIEFKSLPFLGAREKKQLSTYLTSAHYKLGLLVNFGGSDVEIVRTVYDLARNSLRGLPQSAESAIKIPHLLSMSATPIPRTLALTMFGDLDLSVLDELPPGRVPIETILVKGEKGRKEMHEHMRCEMKAGRQIYVICPRIEKSDEDTKAKNLRSVEEEAEYMAETIFPEFVVDSIHGKMKTDDKEEVMRDFLERKSDLLVATSVIEVGVNVPNASIILIEGADRFGLAQLHQLRGRVGRGKHPSFCYLVSESVSEKTEKRLSTLVKAKNGFELAELDMKERGIGALIQGKQWGISDIAMEALKNPKLVELAGSYAKSLIQSNEELTRYPILASLLEEREKVHME